MKTKTDTYDRPAYNLVTQRLGSLETSWEDIRHRPLSQYVSYGDNIIGWRDKMARGEDVTTTLDGVRYVIKPSFGQYTVQTPIFGGRYWKQYGDLMSIDIDTSDIEPSVLSKALTTAAVAFAKNYRKKTRQFQSGVFCGELLETARMLASPARGLRNAADILHSNLLKALKKSKAAQGGYGRAISETWLEWNFGVKPLIQDLDDAARSFRALASGRTFDTIRITGIGEVAESAPGFPTVQVWTPVAGVPDTGTVYRDVIDHSQVTYRGAWRNENPSGQMPIPMIMGATLSDVVPTVWELIPWSFLVDYFVNVGDVLDAWSMRFITFAWLNRTVRNSRTTKYSDIMAVDDLSTPVFRTSSGGHAIHTRSTVSRLPTGNSFPTDFLVKIPGFPEPKKWLNIAALAAMGRKPSWLR